MGGRAGERAGVASTLVEQNRLVFRGKRLGEAGPRRPGCGPASIRDYLGVPDIMHRACQNHFIIYFQ